MAMKIVYGVYQFLGFHIADYLLRKGEKVFGFDPETEAKNGKGEMKEFYVRNANFKQLDNLKDLSLSEGKADIYMVLWNPAALLPEALSFLEQIKETKGLEAIITIFSPLQAEEADIRMVRDACQSQSIGKWIFISRMYGPWMPENSCVYEHIINGEYDKLEKESPIFIDDFISRFDEIMDWPEKEMAVLGENALETQAIPSKMSESPLFKTAFRVPQQTSMGEGAKILLEHKKKVSMIEYWNNK